MTAPDRDKIFFTVIIVAAVATAFYAGLMYNSEPDTLTFLPLEVPAVEFPQVTSQGDTITVQKRWIAREDSSLAREQGWLTGGMEQDKLIIVRRIR